MFILKNYDFIVFGAGTAGCVIASRLSENTDASVLLVDAGSGQPLAAMAVPPAWLSLRTSSACWGELTVPRAVSGARVALPRGRGLRTAGYVWWDVPARSPGRLSPSWATCSPPRSGGIPGRRRCPRRASGSCRAHESPTPRLSRQTTAAPGRRWD